MGKIGTIARRSFLLGSLAIAAALVSLLAGRPLASDTAMTGELTLTGKMLPVGGIKEKVLAARGAGLKRVILPARNRKDLQEIPAALRRSLSFSFVGNLSQLIERVFHRAGPRHGR